MKYLLDTNVVSELMKSAPDPKVKKWVNEHEDDAAVSAIVLAELASGVECLPEGKRKTDLTKRVRFLQEDFEDQILAFDESAAWEWARYIKEAQQAGHSPPLLDSLIAATARAWGLKMVSRDVSDFPLMDVVNPFES